MSKTTKRIICLIMAGMLSVSSSTSLFAQTVALGDRVDLGAFMVNNSDSPDTSEQLQNDYAEDRGAASSSTGTPSADGKDHGVGTDNWKWADWVNNPSTWQSPVSQQNGGGGVTSPNNVSGNKTGNPLSNLFPSVPATKAGLESLLDDTVKNGRGRTKATVLTWDEFLKLIGDQSGAIRKKYEAAKAAAKNKRDGDSTAANEVYKRWQQAQGGTNPWTGKPNTTKPNTKDWLNNGGKATSAGNNSNSPSNTGNNGNTSGSGLDIFRDMMREIYDNMLARGRYDDIDSSPVDKSEYKNDRLVYDGDGYYKGEKTQSAAEILANSSNDDVFIDANGNSYTRADLIRKYGSLDKGLKAVGNPKSVTDLLKQNGGSFSKLPKNYQDAIKKAGIYMDSAGMTLGEAISKYGSYDKMPDSVKDDFDINGYMDNILGNAYGEKKITASDTYKKMMSGLLTTYGSYDKLPDLFKATMDEKTYNNVANAIAKNTDDTDVVREAVKKSFEVVAKNANYDYDTLPAPLRQYLSRAEYSRIQKIAKDGTEPINVDTIKWNDKASNQLKGKGLGEDSVLNMQLDDQHGNMDTNGKYNEHSNTKTALYYCGVCHSFYSGDQTCACGKYNSVGNYQGLKGTDGWLDKMLGSTVDSKIAITDLDPTTDDNAQIVYDRTYNKGEIMHKTESEAEEARKYLTSTETMENAFNPRKLNIPDFPSGKSSSGGGITGGGNDGVDALVKWAEDQEKEQSERNQSESKKNQENFESESKRMSEEVQSNQDELDRQMESELEAYKKKIFEEYEKYKSKIPNASDDDKPSDVTLWTDQDVADAAKELEDAFDQTIPSPDSFGDVPRIEDTPEFNESDINKIIKDWPADRDQWTTGMKNFYQDLVNKAKDPTFAKTLREMIENGVFQNDDPNEIAKLMQAYINGFSKEGTEYISLYGTITGGGVQSIKRSASYEVVGNPQVILHCTSDPSYGDRRITNFVWTADQIGTFVATGDYQVATCHYEINGYTAKYSLSAQLPDGSMINIMSHEETVILEDSSGVKEDNIRDVPLNSVSITVTAGDIDLNKTDLYNTKRIR